MEYNTNEKKQMVVYVDPVKVEDCPLPLHLRAWESARKTAHAARRKLRARGMLKKAVWVVLALICVAAAPALLIWLAFDALRKTRRAAGVAF